MNNCVFELMRYFPESRILPDRTLVLDLRGHFKIDLRMGFANDFHLKCVLLETIPHQLLFEHPFKTEKKDLAYKQAILDSMNAYLGSSLVMSDMRALKVMLYAKTDRRKTEKFLESGYDLEVLR